jgi:hypothetical protein
MDDETGDLVDEDEPRPTDEDIRLAVAGARRLVETLSTTATDLRRDWPRLGVDATEAGRAVVDDALTTARRVLQKIEDAAATRGMTPT